MAFCSKCGTQLVKGAKFCPKCGTPSSNGAKPCPYCGNQLVKWAKFCPKCGFAVDDTQVIEEISEEPIGCTIELISVGDSKRQVLETLINILGLEFEEANNMVESAPCTLIKGLPLVQAKGIAVLIQKSGAEIVVKENGIPVKGFGAVQEEEESLNDDSEDNSKKWIIGGVCTIVILAACYLFGGIDGGNIETTNEIPQEVPEQSATAPQTNVDDLEKEKIKRQEKLERQKNEEFSRKAMEYVNQIADIERTMNNIYNKYVASSISNPDMKQMIGVNASADLSNYREKGDRLWYKLINLAREYNNQEAEMSFKQEKESFDEMAIKMGHNITVDIYGN